MRNFKKFELTAVWKKQVVGGIRRAKIIDMSVNLPEPKLSTFANINKKKTRGTIWMRVPDKFRR